MAIRVVRVLEYIYPDPISAEVDRQRWAVQTVMRPRPGYEIRSAVMTPEVLPEGPATPPTEES